MEPACGSDLAVTLADVVGERLHETDKVEVRHAVAIVVHVSETDDRLELCVDSRLLPDLPPRCLPDLLTCGGRIDLVFVCQKLTIAACVTDTGCIVIWEYFLFTFLCLLFSIMIWSVQLNEITHTAS